MGSCCHCGKEAVTQAGEWAKLALAGLMAAQSMVFGLAINLSPPQGTARTVLHFFLAASAIAVFFICGIPLVIRSWRALTQGKIIFDQLFLAGILSAFGASLHCTLTGTGHVYYELVAVLLAIWMFGGILTDSQKRKALDAAGNLGREFAECLVETPEGLQRRKASEVREGDMVFTAAGGAICVDGVVVKGAAFVSESALTGEPYPVVKREGDSVRAGSFTVDSPLVIRASGSSRGLDKLLVALAEARQAPSRLQRSVDRLASWFLPFILVVAGGTFLFWTYFSGWEAGLFRGLSVILVACPCAMGIATPVAIWTALGELAKRGLAARNGDLVEKLARVNHVIFDKTGTLASENLEVAEFRVFDGFDKEEVLGLVGALQMASHHPIARAFHQFGAGENLVEKVESVPGAGLRGIVAGRHLLVGNRAILHELGYRAGEACDGDERRDGHHEVYVAVDGRLAGKAYIKERLRKGVKQGIKELEQIGISTEIMTGDTEESAAIHGLENLRAGMLPEEKAELVRQRKNQGLRVLYVGDGINDSGAMVAADVALAIRGGAPLALDSSEGELAGANLAGLCGMILVARRALSVLRGNLIFAAIYNLVGVALAASGILHPVVAALLMVLSSFVVTTRAIRWAEAGADRIKPGRGGGRGVGKIELLGSAAVGLAIFFQGVVLAEATRIRGYAGAGLVLLFALAGICAVLMVLYFRLSPGGWGAVLMFSVGGLAMLLGWWADAGFMPILGTSAAVCGLAGLFGSWSWMQPAMVLAALPMLVFERERGSDRVVCWGAGLFGMLAGMDVASWFADWLPDRPAPLATYISYFSMVFGMVLGMMICCALIRRLLRFTH